MRVKNGRSPGVTRRSTRRADSRRSVPCARVIVKTPSCRSLLVEVLTTMQPLDDLGSLQHFALSGRVRGDVARPGNEDVSALLGVAPLLVLLHRRFYHLIRAKVG